MKQQFKQVGFFGAMMGVLVLSGRLLGAEADDKLGQLKTNADNAKANEQQYRQNMETANKNISEIERALKDLRDQRTKLKTSTKNVEQNKLALDQMKGKVQVFKKEEAEKLKKDDAKLKELDNLRAEVEKVKKAREANLESYDKKMAEIDKEKSDWDTQIRTAGDIDKEITKKEQAAVAERKKWSDKRDGYRDESNKWNAQAKEAELTYKKYNRLKE